MESQGGGGHLPVACIVFAGTKRSRAYSVAFFLFLQRGSSTSNIYWV